MEQIYKIFVNDNPFVVAREAVDMPGMNHFTVIEHANLRTALDQIKSLESLQSKGCLYLCEDPTAFFKELLKEFILIKAAGGIVFNKNQDLLLIKRLGKWDLPKGKIDPHEGEQEAAIREVQEECGIKELQIKKFLNYSYHTYRQQGYRFLKQTSWYLMESSWTGKLHPQVEENITEVKWQPWRELKLEQLDSYLSIKDILRQVKI